jgi:hypothetical protein
VATDGLTEQFLTAWLEAVGLWTQQIGQGLCRRGEIFKDLIQGWYRGEWT